MSDVIDKYVKDFLESLGKSQRTLRGAMNKQKNAYVVMGVIFFNAKNELKAVNKELEDIADKGATRGVRRFIAAMDNDGNIEFRAADGSYFDESELRVVINNIIASKVAQKEDLKTLGEQIMQTLQARLKSIFISGVTVNSVNNDGTTTISFPNLGAEETIRALKKLGIVEIEGYIAGRFARTLTTNTINLLSVLDIDPPTWLVGGTDMTNQPPPRDPNLKP
jgi:hypothetical protein